MPSSTAAGQAGGEEGFLLSEEGCGRATGYAEANKIVALGDRTNVAWLDSPEEGCIVVRAVWLFHWQLGWPLPAPIW